MQLYSFKNFKGFAETELELGNPLTVLIGPNGSGKSNLIEAIEVFSFIAHGGLLHEIADAGRGGRLEIRGGLQSCSRYQHDSFSLGFEAIYRLTGQPIHYLVSVQTTPTPKIREEFLKYGDRTIFETIAGKPSSTSGDILVKYDNLLRGPNKPQKSFSASRSVLSQYQSQFQDLGINKNKPEHDDFFKFTQELTGYLRAAFVFDPNPKLIREYQRIGDNQLAKNEANLAAVLYALQQGDEKQQQSLARLLNWIKQLPNEPYQNFEFVTTQPKLDDVIFGLTEAGHDGQFVSAKILSDGTLRCLAVLTALETAQPGSRVVIEEFDNGLHPSRVGMLAQAIQECCRDRKLNVLVTTHNPATLNALTPEQLEGVVLCAKEGTEAGAKLMRLSELPRYAELLERGLLGDLVTRRIIDQYLLPNFEEERKQRGLEWLESLQHS